MACEQGRGAPCCTCLHPGSLGHQTLRTLVAGIEELNLGVARGALHHLASVLPAAANNMGCHGGTDAVHRCQLEVPPQPRRCSLGNRALETSQDSQRTGGPTRRDQRARHCKMFRSEARSPISGKDLHLLARSAAGPRSPLGLRRGALPMNGPLKLLRAAEMGQLPKWLQGINLEPSGQ